MATYINCFLESFWTNKLWLPENITWADLEPGSNPNMNFPDYRRLLISICLAFLIFMFRMFLEMEIFTPLGIYLGIENKKFIVAQPNPILEKSFQKNRKLLPKIAQGLAKQCDITEAEVKIWFRQRRLQNKPTELKKFCEGVFRLTYYTTLTIIGYSVLKNKVWFGDISQTFANYPFHNLDKSVEWYYLISLSFYVSLVVTQFYDVKRKDFWELFIHHIATIILITFSFICNYFRIGSLILITHDIADVFLDLAKLLKYVKCHKLADVTFTIFILVWFATRLYVYPQLVYHMFFNVYDFKTMHFAHLFLCIMSLTLQLLHLIWTYYIINVLYEIIKTRKLNDPRSDSEDSDEINENIALNNNSSN